MPSPEPRRIPFIDSHTGGEPTRVVIDGGPDLGHGSMAERLQILRTEHDRFRSAVVNEPRGSDVLVGAILLPPESPEAVAGVIFFNNVGYLGMCGHGLIGLVVTLAHLGRLGPGTHAIDTPVGRVSARLHPDGRVSVSNVPSHRQARGVRIEVPGLGPVTGDVAWGGNWFFLVKDHPHDLSLRHAEALVDYTWKLRQAINAQGFPEVDHVELFSESAAPGADSRNFVLCPGKAFDRSPCGTGTSAKLACLAADGTLGPGEEWIQESIIGSTFIGRYEWIDPARGLIRPEITGTAHVMTEGTLLLQADDPFCWGIR